MPEHLRREYMQRAGLTDEQLEQAIVGVSVPGVLGAGEKITSAHAAVRRLLADALIISSKYHKIAQGGDLDAREVVDATERATDQTLLDEMIADDYSFSTPYGETVDKRATINTILSGTIQPQTMGRGGYEHTGGQFKVQGDTAALTTTLLMAGAGLAKNRSTGEIEKRDLTGTYRHTQTFVFRQGRWQLVSTDMKGTPAAKAKDFDFVGEQDTAK
jgi:hypothetical protein